MSKQRFDKENSPLGSRNARQREEFPRQKQADRPVAIGVLNVESFGPPPYLCQMNEFAGVSRDNKVFFPPVRPLCPWDGADVTAGQTTAGEVADSVG